LNAHLNGLEAKLTVHESDVFDALPPAAARSAPSWAPFDAILANPPFVAVPPAPADADVNALWALYADAWRLGGPFPTLLEWDDHIPAMPAVLDELAKAKTARE
jgi:hypothetical protein